LYFLLLTRKDGSLAVTGAKDTIPLINKLLSSPHFYLKVATQDWHPKDHISFSVNHPPPNNKPFESYVEIQNHVANRPEETMSQRLWPVHCVQNTRGAELVDELDVKNIDVRVKKGMDSRVDMYSAFSDSFGNLTAGKGGVSEDLAELCKAKEITHAYVVGVASDYCVKFTAIDASKSGLDTQVIVEGVRGVDPSTWDDVKKEFTKHNVKVVSVDDDVVKRVLVSS
jgi:nicotinamidase-related amidase